MDHIVVQHCVIQNQSNNNKKKWRHAWRTVFSRVKKNQRSATFAVTQSRSHHHFALKPMTERHIVLYYHK